MKRDKGLENTIKIANMVFFEQARVYLQQGKYVTIAVKGKSMWPFLKEGDKVVLKPFMKADLKRGVVLLADIKGDMLLHRLVKYDDEGVLLAGDHNLVAHEWALHENVLASVAGISWQRQLGLLWYWARPIRRVMMKIVK